MSPVRFALTDIADVDFYHGNMYGTDAIGKGNGGVRIGGRIHDNGIVLIVSFLKLINKASFMIALIKVNLMIGKSFFQFVKEGFK